MTSYARIRIETAITLAVIVALILVAHALGIALCPLRRFTGVPCPLCGATRAGLCLLRGDLAGAFALQPLVTIAAFAVPLAFLVRRWITFKLPRSAVGKWSLALVAGGLVAANWAYLIMREV